MVRTHLLYCGALIGKASGGGVRQGGGYVLSPAENLFEMLASLQKEFKGAVGIALLNYCALCFQA
jgi:hypothetical protein